MKNPDQYLLHFKNLLCKTKDMEGLFSFLWETEDGVTTKDVKHRSQNGSGGNPTEGEIYSEIPFC